MNFLFILSDGNNNTFPTIAPDLDKAIDALTLKSLKLSSDKEVLSLQALGNPFEVLKRKWKSEIKNVQAIPQKVLVSPLPCKTIIYGS